VQTKEFIIKNEKFIDQPRYQHLSYNKISTRLKIPVLIKLKEWMKDYMPASLDMNAPFRVRAYVHDWAMPMHKDLDNMHIYYKAFLDLLKQRGMIKDDSKQYITEAGGFQFVPIFDRNQRKLVFEIVEDDRPIIKTHVMYNLEPKSVKRDKPAGYELKQVNTVEPGYLQVVDHVMFMNFGKTKVIKSNADKLFRGVYNHCVNHSTCCWVSEEFYRIHADRIERFLLSQGLQVIINVKK